MAEDADGRRVPGKSHVRERIDDGDVLTHPSSVTTERQKRQHRSNDKQSRLGLAVRATA
jgi:hypothetical protein